MFVLMVLCLVASTLAVKLPAEYCVNEQDHYTIPQVHAHGCACNAKAAGTLRYHDNKIQYCNGAKYVELGGKEHEYGSEEAPATSCHEILKKNRYLMQCMLD
jgi:hypothetical protein